MSNLAYKIDFESERQEAKQEFQKKSQNNQKIHIMKLKAKVKFHLVLFVVGMVGIGLFTVNNFQKVSALQSEVDSIKKTNLAIQKEIDAKEAKLEEIRSGKRVEEEAANILGMIYPEESNKIYINSKENNISVKSKKEKNNTVLGALFR